MNSKTTLLIGLLGASILSMQSANSGEPPKIAKSLPSVEQLAQAKFERVPGGATDGAVLDAGPPGSWYSTTVGMPTIDFDGELYRMWFVGDEPITDPKAPYGIRQRVGLATSKDGLHWKLANDGQPVLEPGPEGTPDAKGLAHPYVLRVADKFLMWYGAIDGTLAGDLGLKPASVRVERICLATSPDGIHWERENGGKPVMDIGPKGTIDSIQATGMHVLLIDGRFVMWYGAYGGDHTLGLASSPDGIHWKRLNSGKPILGLVAGNQGQCGVTVYFDGNRYFMLYGADKGGEWKTYAATSDDGIHFEQLRGDEPVLALAPAGNFDTAGKGRNHLVHPTQFVVTDRKVRVWYMGEDGSPPHHQRIGLMEASLP